MGLQNKSVRTIIKNQLETFFALYYLNKTCGFHFQCISIYSFDSEAFVVWMLF